MGSELDDIFAICFDQTLYHDGETLLVLEQQKGWESNIFNIISLIDII